MNYCPSDYRAGDEDNPHSPFYESKYIVCCFCGDGVDEEDCWVHDGQHQNLVCCIDCADQHGELADVIEEVDYLNDKVQKQWELLKNIYNYKLQHEGYSMQHKCDYSACSECKLRKAVYGD